jgi:rhodanese-related sulfurtransferase
MDTARLIEFATNHWMMICSLLIVTILLIQDIIETLLRKYKAISSLATVGLMNQADCLILDVREPDEYAKGHIEGARLYTLNRLAERIHELDAHKSQPVVVVCQSGTRSPDACKTLIKNGFSQVYNLSGGMMEWEDSNLPVTTKKKK